MLTQDRMVAVQLALALLGSLLLACTWLLQHRGESLRYRRARDVALAALGALSFASWWNFGYFHFDDYVHLWEHYHYYLGAKYAPELGYTRLYDCTNVADLADGLRAKVEARTIRDLHGSNDLISTAAIVANPGSCTSHFSPERWAEFRRDIRFFRANFTEGGWERVQRDHGYNPSPVWAVGGRLLAQMVPIDETRIRWLAAVDSLLLVAMWGLVWWGFGWRAMCVALLWWGTNFPARFYWNGGALLRFDWLLTLVAGICLLKRDKPLGAGLALTYSALLRIFPGFVLAALVLKVLVSAMTERRLALSVSQQRFAAGCLLALALLLPAGAWATGSFLPAWIEFAQNSAGRLATPAPNSMGLEAIVGWDPSSRKELLHGDDPIDPFKGWVEARRAVHEQRRPVYLGLLAAFVLLLAAAVRHEPDWAVACLGCGGIVMAAYLSCYYYGFLLGFALLWERRRLPGVLTCALAAVTCALYFVLPEDDEQYAYMSLAAALAVTAVTAQVAFRPLAERAH